MTQVFNRFSERQKRQELREVMPKAEVVLWSQLQRRQFDGHKFRRQCSIGRYVVDFYCPRSRLVIELDGDSHFNDVAEKYDRVRNQYMESLGLRVVRFTNEDVRKNLSRVLQRIRGALVSF
ncbi:MAG: endonuclease domain-containing protein [Patescibacteria group bacterium]